MSAPRRIRIFQVDDSRDATVLMKYLVQAEDDLEIVGTRHDASGLEEEIRRTAPDVVLLDLHMPGKDPLEAIQELRASFPSLRIVSLSGTADPRLLDRAREAGATGHIPKTLDISATLDAIRGQMKPRP